VGLLQSVDTEPFLAPAITTILDDFQCPYSGNQGGSHDSARHDETAGDVCGVAPENVAMFIELSPSANSAPKQA